ncbi:ribokinase [Rhizobium lusitanum]|uniref:Ribokinase n=1 Tax=Rhizobium lusitanum TaxID=293958 RepID=A0A6L9UB39_9HYPH|nr:ribokinase [Rhizobium lusitanum]NEI72579.1 ribokinase [Rhizobium lusitanum]
MRASIPHRRLLVFGSINADLVTSPDRLPSPGETVLSPSYQMVNGGKGANQAVAAARSRISVSNPVLMVGAVGRDAFADQAVGDLQSNGVDVRYVARTASPTGCAFIAVDPSGENMITVALGANLDAQATQLTMELVTSGTILLMQNEIPMSEAIKAARQAREAGAMTILNLAPAPEGEAAAAIRDLLGSIDILVVNEHEFAVVCQVLCIPDCDGPKARVAALSKDIGADVVVTMGASGTLLGPSSGPVVHKPALAVAPVDTTGAGDTLTGVLAASLLDGLPLEDALTRANRAETLSCMAMGARDGMPSAAALDASLMATAAA